MRGGDVRLARRLLWRNRRAAAAALAARGRQSLHTGRGGCLARRRAPSPALCLRPRRCDAGLLLRRAPGMWPAAARHAGRRRVLLRRRPSPRRRPRLHSWLGRARDGAGHVCGQVAARHRARRPRQPDRLAARGARGRGQAAGRGRGPAGGAGSGAGSRRGWRPRGRRGGRDAGGAGGRERSRSAYWTSAARRREREGVRERERPHVRVHHIVLGTLGIGRTHTLNSQ
mmetsp:Transcript_19535/g.64593  ORF Transcript_19535/g.64593 Transcript_19535/m.64593 type:complete len:228 (-) Transcript_19535:45-728(-)